MQKGNRSKHLSVDSLMMSDADLTRYKGHHAMFKYHLIGGQPNIVEVPSDEPVDRIKEWLRPSRIQPDDIPRWKRQRAIKILFVQTHNEYSANPNNNPVYRIIPGETPVTSLKDHIAQGRMIKDIFQHARLPLAALGSYIKAHMTFMSIPSYHVGGDHVDGGEVSSYYVSSTSWSVAWSFFHATEHTSAVVFYREGDGDERRKELEAELLKNQEYLGHPLLLAYLKSKISLQWTFHLLDQMNGQTLEIEKSVGLATWDWVLDRRIDAYRDPKTVEEESEEAIAKAQKNAIEMYNVVSGKLNNIRFRLRSFGEQLTWLRRVNRVYLGTVGKNELMRRHECTSLEDTAYQMFHLTKVHLHDADTLFDRLAQQMKSMAQLVSQRDSRISMAIADFNNELAWQGKNANRAMMAIAVVSSIFLPGTFVASLFQAPIFNWQPKGNEVVVVTPFWIYWGVCGGLTAVLAIGWFWYIKHRSITDKLKREKASQAFKRRILRTPTLTKTKTLSVKEVSTDKDISGGGWFTWLHSPREPDVEKGLSGNGKVVDIVEMREL